MEKSWKINVEKEGAPWTVYWLVDAVAQRLQLLLSLFGFLSGLYLQRLLQDRPFCRRTNGVEALEWLSHEGRWEHMSPWMQDFTTLKGIVWLISYCQVANLRVFSNRDLWHLAWPSMAPCRLQGCKNRPAVISDWMS